MRELEEVEILIVPVSELLPLPEVSIRRFIGGLENAAEERLLVLALRMVSSIPLVGW